VQEIKRFWPCVAGIAATLYLIGGGSFLLVERPGMRAALGCLREKTK